jgi:uncharacterized membrane protein
MPNWAIPALYAACAILAGLLLPRLEATWFPASTSGLSPVASMAIFSAMGSGMIALTGIVFSLAFVMLQFSATAYSPRLVLWLARDRVLWHSVGVFFATFLYSIAAIAWVDRAGTNGTPFVSGWLVIALLVASLAMFIALIVDLITALPQERHEALRGHKRRLEAIVARSFPDVEELEDASTEDRQGLGTPGRR